MEPNQNNQKPNQSSANQPSGAPTRPTQPQGQSQPKTSWNGPKNASASGQPAQNQPSNKSLASPRQPMQKPRHRDDNRKSSEPAPMLKSAGNSYDSIPVNKSLFNGLAGKQITQVKTQGSPAPRVANQAIKVGPNLRVIPLGGFGEIGKNMMAIEYGEDIIVIDMGFMFPTDDQPGIDYIIPDTTYLERNKHKIRGHILTHAHEDHMGGVPYILPKLPAPFFGARFSLGMLEKKLVEYKLATQPQFRVMDPDKHERVQLGVFNVELVRVTHSIPDACAVVVRTPIGTIVHTGDWRFDPTPIDNKPADLERLREIGDEGVLLLLSDSTGCEDMGRTLSELEIEPTFEDIFRRQKGRIIISSFASQINRVQLVVDATQKTGRKLAFTGRSMLANVELAVKLGYLKIPGGLIVRIQDIIRLPDEEVVVLSTGSQGELNSALTRMSTGDHPQIKIKPNDAVILSSSVIPGNEKSVVVSVDALMREGAKVYQNRLRAIDDCGIMHVSGHASRDELVEMLALIRPAYFIPEHGEFHHLVRHAELAVTNGIPRDHVFVMDNGDVVEFDGSVAKRAERVPAGKIMIDGTGVGDVEGVVLRDRLAMASDGIFVIVATVGRSSGKLITSPDIISRGFIYMKENEELVNRARGEVRKMFERRSVKEPTDWTKFKLKMRDEIGDFLYNATKRNPMIITVINEV
ncbi:MAG: RNase J family beta-CASP ribonuclease [Candidatus Saccharimonadia bacterium]